MNSYSARKGRFTDEKTATKVETTATVHAPAESTEITEITIRVRPAPPPHASNFNEFDVSHLRAEQAEAVRVESLVKGFVDQLGARRRVAPRYAKQLSVVVYCKNRSFRTSTVNISVGGARLRDELPTEFQYGKIEILFINEDPDIPNKQYLMFKGEAVTNSGPSDRIRFVSAAQSVQDAFADMLRALDPKLIVA